MRAVGIRARGFRRGFDQAPQQVDLVVVVGALEDGGGALQPHAGVDRRTGQIDAFAPAKLLELHEDQVPDLDETVAVFAVTAGRAAGEFWPVVVEDLRARPAGPGIAHGPEVVRRGDAQDAVFGQTGDLAPEIEGLVVVRVDGDQEAVRRQPELTCYQGPGQLDGQVLEVVAEGEVAQHLEEGVVAGRQADVLQVVVLAAGAHALLGGHRAHVIAALQPGEQVLELDHAGAGEHQRRVVPGHQGP